MSNVLTGKVLKVLSKTKLVINKGAADGVVMDNRFLIYKLGEEIIDPDTNENLGTLEIVCGEAKPEHIQDRFTTVVSSQQNVKEAKKVVKYNGFSALLGTSEEVYDPEVTVVPFEDVDNKCLFKQIR